MTRFLFGKLRSLLSMAVALFILWFFEVQQILKWHGFKTSWTFKLLALDFSTIIFLIGYFGFYIPVVKKDPRGDFYRFHKKMTKVFTFSVVLFFVLSVFVLKRFYGLKSPLISICILHVLFKVTDFFPTLNGNSGTDITHSNLTL